MDRVGRADLFLLLGLPFACPPPTPQYPYQAQQQRCQFNASEAHVRVRASANITFQDEDELVAAIATAGPVSVAFQVAPDFRLYDGGVYNSKVCASGPEDVNHAVLAVGYGVDEVGGPFYWIKNSWGPGVCTSCAPGIAWLPSWSGR